MLVSRNRDWIDHARKLSTQAREPAPHYEHTEIGFNYRLSNLLAALGRAQLAVLRERVEARRNLNGRYRELLADTPGISFMPEAGYGRTNCWLTCVVVDPDRAGTDRERIRLALEAEDIESRPLWKPMHLQPVYRDAPVYGGEVSAALFEHGLCLPSGSALHDDDQRRVVGTLLGTRG
jgi:dTDP-4-amino-4,6-dideoxygalactose transaminase